MKRLLTTATILCGAIFASQSQAHNIGDIVTVTGYGTPDSAAWNSVTTNGYSNYTGPIVLDLSDGTSITVYCADLNHILSTGGEYIFEPLTEDGTGNPLSPSLSHRIGVIAQLGLSALAANDLDKATAAQAAIWDDEYGISSVTSNTTIGGDIASLLPSSYPASTHDALAMIPYGEGWFGNADASQQMVVGLLAVPEPASLGLLGLGLLGTIAVARRRSAYA